METFGDYELRGLLGRGGMGDVHRAYDTRRGREVALKLLPAHLANDRRLVERFRREARALVRFTDPYIVPVHDYGEIDGRLFIDMALVDGRDLASILSDGRLPPARAVHVVEQAARALDTAHRHGVVHRDVKPSNLLVLTDRGDFTYLVDFGISHAVGTALTSTGSTIGTLAYMAPERFAAGNAVDGRVDVYALACVLFQMLTGEHPFPFEDAPALLHAHLHLPPPAVTARRPELAPAWDRVVARGMAKDPADRYPTAGALAADARAALHVPAAAPPHADPPTTPHTVRPGTRRAVRPAAVAGAVIATVAVVAGAVVAQRAGTGPEPAAAAPTVAPVSTVEPGSTYVTYRDPQGRFTVDVPASLITRQPTADGVRFTSPGTPVLAEVTVATGADLGTVPTRSADQLAAFEAAGGTVRTSGRDTNTFEFAGTDRAGNTVVSRSRFTGDAAGTVTWTYPPVDESAWAAFVDRSSRSLTPS